MDDCGGTGGRLDALLMQDSDKWSDGGKHEHKPNTAAKKDFVYTQCLL